MKKTCRLCKIEKPETIEFFYKKRNGYDNRCKLCLSEYSKELYRKDIVNQRARSIKRWKNLTPEKKEERRVTRRKWGRSIKGIFNFYKQNARARNKSFELTREQFNDFIYKNCIYCGEPSKGIDRVDNSKGYTLENSVSCCGRCNIMKNDMTVFEFINKCKVIYENSKEQLDDYWNNYK